MFRLSLVFPLYPKIIPLSETAWRRARISRGARVKAGRSEGERERRSRTDGRGRGSGGRHHHLPENREGSCRSLAPHPSTFCYGHLGSRMD